MDSGTVALLILAVLVVFGAFSVLKLFLWLNRRCYRKLLRGNLREDYIRNHPDLVHENKLSCVCGNKKIVLRNLGLTRLEGSDVIREHVCQACGIRLFYSTSGSYFESIVRELRKEAGFDDGGKILALNRLSRQ